MAICSYLSLLFFFFLLLYPTSPSVYHPLLLTPPSSSLPIPWDITILKLGQSVTLQRPLSIQGKSIGCFFKLGLEMIKLSEEGTVKAKTGWKPDLLAKHLGKLWMQRKGSWRKLKLVFSLNIWMIGEQNSLTVGVERVSIVWRDDQTSHNIPLTTTFPNLQKKLA